MNGSSFPRKAGIQRRPLSRWPWTPAFAGVTAGFSIRRADCLADALQCLAVFGRQPGVLRIEMHVARPLRQLDHLDEALGRRPDRYGPDRVVGPAATGPVGLAAIALAGLLVFDPHAVHLAAGALAGGAGR